MEAKIYETPDTWGNETFYLTEAQAEKIIDGLNTDLGWSVSIDDCDECELVKDLGDGTAVYAGSLHHDGYHKKQRRYGIVIRKHGDDYVFVESYNTVDSAIEDIENQ